MATKLHPISRDIAVLSRAGYPLIYVITQEEQRALDLIEAAAAAGRRSLAHWSVAKGFGDGEHLDPSDAIDSLAATSDPALFVLLDFHRFLDDPKVVRRIRERLPECAQRRQSVIIVAPVYKLPPEIEKEAAVIDLPLPNTEELTEVLREVAESEKVGIEPDVVDRAVRSALGLAVNQATRVFRKVMVLRKGLTGDDLGLIVEEKKNVLRTTEVLEFHELGDSLSDVGGLGELKRWLDARTAAFGEDARRFGLPPPKGLLLLGVQGCGKSLSAKAVADFWKFPLLRLDVGAVFSGSSGSPEASIREAIKISESLSPVVLWVDEIEKGFTSSEKGGQSDARVFGTLLTWLAEKSAEVFVVATANDVSSLPPELLRRGRFDEVFFVDLPNVHERTEILRIHMRKRKREPDRYPLLEDVAKRAEHFSGAELEQVIVSALYNAFSNRRDISAADLELALKHTVPLYRTYEEKIKELREWARTRARPATLDSTVLDLFGGRL
ncbi:MAG: AAA family ATPase [Deltaproteobacteria bacterium]|nr:AAA family ATPase [Deltaproteobacteria bacterium]